MLNFKNALAAAACATAIVAGAAAPAIAADAPSAVDQGYTAYCRDRNVHPTNDVRQNYKNAESVGAFYGNYAPTNNGMTAAQNDVQVNDATSAEDQAYTTFCWKLGKQPTNDAFKNYENAEAIGAVEYAAPQNDVKAEENDVVVSNETSAREKQDVTRGMQVGVKPTNDVFQNYNNARSHGLAQ